MWFLVANDVHNCVQPGSAWWRHGSVSRVSFCEGNPKVIGLSMDRNQSFRNLIFLSLAWTICWTSSQFAGDLRRHEGEYDTAVMVLECVLLSPVLCMIVTRLVALPGCWLHTRNPVSFFVISVFWSVVDYIYCSCANLTTFRTVDVIQEKLAGLDS